MNKGAGDVNLVRSFGKEIRDLDAWQLRVRVPLPFFGSNQFVILHVFLLVTCCFGRT
jgi:hypothetical protein